MHLPRLWTDAPVAKSRSRGEQNSKGSKGSTQGPQQTQPKKERKGETNKKPRERGGQVGQPTTGGGAGSAEEDRAEKAAHITLE